MDIIKQYIYLGRNLDLPELRLNEGSVYYGEKIDMLLKKYPLLSRILIAVDELPKMNINKVILFKITDELEKNLNGGNE